MLIIIGAAASIILVVEFKLLKFNKLSNIGSNSVLKNSEIGSGFYTQFMKSNRLYSSSVIYEFT